MDRDFVVAGGGPAGLHFGRVAADEGFDVTVLDRMPESGMPKKSTAGTFEDLFEAFDVPKSVAMNENDTVVYEGEDVRLDFDSTNYVLEYGEFQEWLAEDAESKGGEIVQNARVDGAENGSVNYTLNGSDENISGDVLIDATGPEAALMDHPETEKWVGFEQELENVQGAEDEMVFILDQDYAPGGYSWIFSTGGDEAKVGVCWSERINDAKGAEGNLQDYFEKLWRDDERLQDAEIIPGERHAGAAYSNTGLSRVRGDVMGIGDTVDSLNPIFLEGIRPGMESAEMALEASTEDGEVSADDLGAYGEAWRSEKGRNWFISKMVQEVLYSSGNKRIDDMLEDVDELDPSSDMTGYDFSVGDVLEVYSPSLSDVSNVSHVASDHLRNRYGKFF